MPSLLDEAAKRAFPSLFGQEKDAVTLYIGTSVYEAWEAIRITRSLEQLTGSFAVTMNDRWRQEADKWPLKPGEPCLIKIGGKQAINGYIDKIDAFVANDSRRLEISGRDKTMDLIDSSAYGDVSEYLNITVDQLAKKFATELFGINIKLLVDPGLPFQKFSIKPGESIFQMLERAAKLRGLLLLTDGEGNLVITNRAGGDIGEAPSLGTAKQAKDVFGRPTVKNLKPTHDFSKTLNLSQSPTDLVQGENILEAQASFDYTDRYQSYIVKGQSSGSDVFNRKIVSQAQATSKDLSITRGRVKVIVADGAVDFAAAQKRANWEAIVRATKSVDVQVKVQGWLKSDDTLWKVNELVFLDAQMIGVRAHMLVTNVTFSKSITSGTITNLRLTRPDAYNPLKPILTAESDPSQDLGWGKIGIGKLIDTFTEALNV